MSNENGRLQLVLSIDMPNTGQRQEAQSGSRPVSPAIDPPPTTTSGRSTAAPTPPSRHATPTQEALIPKQLVLVASGTSASIGTTKLEEVPARSNVEPDTESDSDPDLGADAFLSARQRRQKQQSEMEQRLFRAPTRSDIQVSSRGSGAGRGRKLVRFDEATSSPGVVNLSGFFARQAARARPIFSPKFDRLGRRSHPNGTQRSNGSVVGRAQDPAPTLLSLASLDIATTGGNPARQQGATGSRRRSQRKSGAVGSVAKQLTMRGSSTMVNAPSPIPVAIASLTGCSDIVKRRQPPPSPVGNSMRIDIDLTPEGQKQLKQTNQHQPANQHSHQLSVLLGRFHLPKTVLTKASGSSEDAAEQPASNSGPFRLAEPRLKLNHFSSSRHPNSFYYLNTRMHIHTP